MYFREQLVEYVAQRGIPVGDDLFEMYVLSMNWSARLLPGLCFFDISYAAQLTASLGIEILGTTGIQIGETGWGSVFVYDKATTSDQSGSLREFSFDTDKSLNLTLTELIQQTIERIDARSYLVKHSRVITNVDEYEELAHGQNEVWLLGTSVYPRDDDFLLDNPMMSTDHTFRVHHRPS